MTNLYDLPSGKLTSPFLNVNQLLMAIFNSYVKITRGYPLHIEIFLSHVQLPEGNTTTQQPLAGSP
jgi:hypothetical protein